jgi:hypothetical protein
MERVSVVGVLAMVLALPAIAPAQEAVPSRTAAPRAGAVSLQDLPRVRIDDAEGASRSRVAYARKAKRPGPDAYIFLSSTPGSYRRATPLTKRLSYVEQLERSQRYVTFQAGLRVAVGK